jgi:hypothetical protein
MLQCIINKAHDQGLLTFPIPSYDSAGYPIIQYMDDTIIVMKAAQRELLCLKALLETFAQATWLRINFAKFGLVPINLTPEKAEIMAGTLGCKIQTMLFTYLGLPMGSTKPKVEHFAPLMNRAERQLTSMSSLLTYAGKLQLVNSVLSSLPTFYMCSASLPVAVHEYFDKIRYNSLWRKFDVNANAKPLVAWKKCTKPKQKGRLGIINTRAQNNALLIKQLTSFTTKRYPLGPRCLECSLL